MNNALAQRKYIQVNKLTHTESVVHKSEIIFNSATVSTPSSPFGQSLATCEYMFHVIYCERRHYDEEISQMTIFLVIPELLSEQAHQHLCNESCLTKGK